MGSDSGFSQFINTTDDSGRVPLVNTANPVNWTRLGLTIVGVFVTAWSVGTQAVIYAVQQMLTTPYEATTEFIVGVEAAVVSGRYLPEQEGLLDVVFDPFVGGLYRAWTISLSEFGLLAYPIAAAMVLAAYWMLARGLQYMRKGGVV